MIGGGVGGGTGVVRDFEIVMYTFTRRTVSPGSGALELQSAR